jgi:hypothetical protein
MKSRLFAIIAALSLVLTASPLYAASKTVTEGFLCNPKGPKTGVTSTGKKVTCTLMGDGKSAWQGSGGASNGPTNNGKGSGNQGGSNSNSERCTKNGELTLSSVGLTQVCRNGKWAWPISTDAPKMPVGGWKSRPSWYPTLKQTLADSSAKATTCKASSVKFTSPVIPLDQMAPTIPYGGLLFEHILPADFSYLGLKVLSKTREQLTESDYVPITAPADGVIIELSSIANSTNLLRVVIRHDCGLYSNYMVMNKASGVLASYANKLTPNGLLKPMVAIKAGQEFGRQRDNSLDFNTFDSNSWLSGFVNPFAYLTQDRWKPFLTDYLQYFTPELRSAFANQLQSKGSATAGKIDWDIAGAASGNWFLKGTNGYGGILDSDILKSPNPVHDRPDGKNGYTWSHLALVPHNVDSKHWIFSTGWFSNPAGDFKHYMIVPEGGAPNPDKLTASSGLVAYRVVSFVVNEPAGSPARNEQSNTPFAVGYTLSEGTTAGVVGLQINNDGTLSVEVNTNMTSAAEFTSFTGAKRIYHR